jgi:hypothetical protein
MKTTEVIPAQLKPGDIVDRVSFLSNHEVITVHVRRETPAELPALNSAKVTDAAAKYAEYQLPPVLAENVTREMAVMHLRQAFIDGARAMRLWAAETPAGPADLWLAGDDAAGIRQYIAEDAWGSDRDQLESLFRGAFRSGLKAASDGPASSG